MDLSNNEVRHVKIDGVEFLEFKVFDDYRDRITVAFVIKGESGQYYCGQESGCHDEINHSLGIEKEIQIKQQMHGDVCEIAYSPTDTFDECDGIITSKKGVALATRVADCIAVLMFDPVSGTVANIHSGWRGTVKRIAPKAVMKMRDELSVDPSSIICVLCPSICPNHFEVDDDVRNVFVKEFGGRHLRTEGSKTHIDAAAYVKDSLIGVGVKAQNIHNSGICTVCNSSLLFSYRADRQLDQKYRNVAIICLK